MKKFLGRLIAAILVVIGLFGGTKDYLTEREFQRDAKIAAVTAFADIHETVYKETRQKGVLGTKKVSYFSTHSATVRFETADKEHISVSREVPADTLQRYQGKEQVFIRYLPRNPEYMRWMGEAGEDYSAGLIFGGIALLYLIISFTLFKDE